MQNLKNRTTAIHQAAASLNAPVKIGLTGTPIENSRQDLRSLFDICLPGYLGSERQFERLYAQPITESGNPEVREGLGRLIHPFILRRNRAQAVIHYDRWWNPAREEQATARVHRMGQRNVVQVFRLITKGTLEEKIHQLITKKRALSTSLIQEDEAGIIKQMDRKQLAELFHFAPTFSG